MAITRPFGTQFRYCCEDDNNDVAYSSVATLLDEDNCLDVVIATNPSGICGTSATWEFGSSVNGPWTPAFDVNLTCGQSTNNPTIPGAGWITGNQGGPSPDTAPDYYRYEFTLTAAQIADFQSAYFNMAGDSQIFDVFINGTDIYNGTPPNNFDTATGVVPTPLTPFQAGTNEIVICHDPDTFVFDGISFILTLSCDAAPFIVTATPPDQNVSVGGTATITGSATGGTAPYTHQWQESTVPNPTNADPGINLPGETGTTLDVNGV